MVDVSYLHRRSRARPLLLLGVVTMALLPPSPALQAQADTLEADTEHTAGSGLKLAVGDAGLGFGDVPRLHGLRFNLTDERLDRVDGLNVTFWRPEASPAGAVNGVSLALVGPRAATLRGLSLGVVGVLAERRLEGVAIGGIGVLTEGPANGLLVGGLGVVTEGSAVGATLGGLGVVSEETLGGISAAGLGVVSEGNLAGIAAAGLGVVSQGHLAGIAAAGLGVVSQGSLIGIAAAGLGVVTEGDLTGLAAGGLGTVTEGRLTGLAVGGLGTAVQGEIRGGAVGGLGVRAAAARGFALALGGTRLDELDGLAVSTYNRVPGRQRGLAIGIYNDADALRGVQVGLLNRVRDRRPPFEFLPLVNVGF